MWVQSLDWEDPLEEEMATHSNILVWKIPWTEEPGRLQFMGSQRVGCDWTHTHTTIWTTGPLAKCSNQPPSLEAFPKSPCYHNKRHVLCSLHLGNSKPCARNGNEEQIYIYYKLQDHKRYLRMERNPKTEKFEKHCKRGNVTQVARHKIPGTVERPNREWWESPSMASLEVEIGGTRMGWCFGSHEPEPPFGTSHHEGRPSGSQSADSGTSSGIWDPVRGCNQLWQGDPGEREPRHGFLVIRKAIVDSGHFLWSKPWPQCLLLNSLSN